MKPLSHRKIAETLRDTRPPEGHHSRPKWYHAVHAFTVALSNADPIFDRERFLKVCKS